MAAAAVLYMYLCSDEKCYRQQAADIYLYVKAENRKKERKKERKRIRDAGYETKDDSVLNFPF